MRLRWTITVIFALLTMLIAAGCASLPKPKNETKPGDVGECLVRLLWENHYPEAFNLLSERLRFTLGEEEFAKAAKVGFGRADLRETLSLSNVSHFERVRLALAEALADHAEFHQAGEEIKGETAKVTIAVTLPTIAAENREYAEFDFTCRAVEQAAAAGVDDEELRDMFGDFFKSRARTQEMYYPLYMVLEDGRWRVDGNFLLPWPEKPKQHYSFRKAASGAAVE